MKTLSRRGFMRGSAGCATATLAAPVFNARLAYANNTAPQTFTPDEMAALGVLAEAILPGARAEGCAHFIDHHCTVPANDSLLMVRYFDVPPPYADFYRAGLSACNALAEDRFKRPVAELSAEDATALIDLLKGAPPEDWQGPPPFFFYMVLRGDAVDVYYGTEAGFDRLEIPYMAHITPTEKW